ncbi:MAG: hypothetical protein Q8M22_14725 [Actinomycetota bacterium]|nr:hypothetical protein [Actinomycetota bacterium]
MLGWRRTRRLTMLLLLIGVAGALWQRRALSAAPAPEPSWPPFEPTSSPAQGFASSAAEPEPAAAEPEAAPESESSPEPAATWVAPVDGACPDGYPVKANDNSRIFHVPGGRFYDRTIPERCYANADDALADGYRRAKA